MVMTNLDSEVKELSSSTVDTMKQCMAKVSTSKCNSQLHCTGVFYVCGHSRSQYIMILFSWG